MPRGRRSICAPPHPHAKHPGSPICHAVPVKATAMEQHCCEGARLRGASCSCAAPTFVSGHYAWGFAREPFWRRPQYRVYEPGGRVFSQASLARNNVGSERSSRCCAGGARFAHHHKPHASTPAPPIPAMRRAGEGTPMEQRCSRGPPPRCIAAAPLLRFFGPMPGPARANALALCLYYRKSLAGRSRTG